VTHNELRDYIDKFDAAGMVKEPIVSALRAVVDLHKPLEGNEHLCSACWFGDGMMAYPCLTIQAIKKELQ